MASSPLIEGTNLCSFDILANGTEIPDTIGVISIRVDRQLNKIAEAEIVVRDGSPSEQDFEVSNGSTFLPGAEIEIKLGYHSKNDSVFKGVMTKQMIKIDDVTGSQLHVICKDKSLQMTVNRNSAIYTEQTDSAIMEKIIGNYSLSKDVASTAASLPQVVQYYVSDWDFILSRAEVNGMVVYTDAGKVVVAKPNVSATAQLSLTYGYDLTEFDVEINAADQLTDVQGNGWDMSSQKLLDSTSAEPTVNKQGNISGTSLAEVLGPKTTQLSSSVGVDADNLKNWANATLLKSRLARFQGSMSFQGSALAKVNSVIELQGVGDRFNGNAFISGVTQRIEEGQWVTEVQVGLSDESFVQQQRPAAAMASGLIPGMRGLQTGIVKQMYEDPDNQFRVQVTIPILADDSNSVWARLATFYTGNGFGAYFMPEVGDEVILGFMNDDPRFPVILGSVYSSSIPAAETPAENNYIKSLTTSSQLQLKFDDEKKVITLLTPGGNTIVISDEDKGITLTDQNNNTVQMNDSGITVESQSDLTLKAAQDVTIQGMSISMSGTQSVDVSGGSLSLSGDQTTSMTGNASCSISSSGETSIKGTAVMIN